MSERARRRAHIVSFLAAAAAASAAAPLHAGPPSYEIIDIGVADPGDFGSQGFGVSVDGVFAVGRSLGVSNQAFAWTDADGRIDLPNLASRPYGAANGANTAGVIVGTGAVTPFGTDPRPLVWDAATASVSQIALPPGESLGRAWDVNTAGIAVGSVDGGVLEQPAIYDLEAGVSWVITTPAANGSLMRTAFAVNDAGLVAGSGIDPDNAARNVGLVHDPARNVTIEVGALSGANGALVFAMSEAGHVVGSSMLNQGSGRPFIWTEASGMQEIPLPPGTSQGSARGVNADGWAVGVASSAFAVPFLFDGVETRTIQSLLPADTPWDVSRNTSSAALAISDTGVIVGTGVLAGEVRAFVMLPVVPACPEDLDGDGAADFDDLLLVLAAFGDGTGGGDVDGDGDTDFDDLLGVLAAFGTVCG